MHAMQELFNFCMSSISAPSTVCLRWPSLSWSLLSMVCASLHEVLFHNGF